MIMSSDNHTGYHPMLSPQRPRVRNFFGWVGGLLQTDDLPGCASYFLVDVWMTYSHLAVASICAFCNPFHPVPSTTPPITSLLASYKGSRPPSGAWRLHLSSPSRSQHKEARLQ